MNNLLLSYLPPSARAYAELMRFDKPAGWLLLALPGLWSLSLSGHILEKALPPVFLCFLMVAGAILMRGAGCVYNDILDREIDRHVARTRNRPIASQKISVFNASFFCLLLCLLSAILLFQFNFYTQILGFFSLIPVALYPFMKRYTQWPQVFLGIAFSWGALIGWSAHMNSLSWSAFLLYMASFLWIIGYDTIYAHQDREDDSLIGIGSSALAMGAHTKIWLFAFYSLTAFLLGTAFVFSDCGPLAFLGLLGFIGHFIWQILTLDIDDSTNCLKRFQSNTHAGLIIWTGLVLDALIMHGW